MRNIVPALLLTAAVLLAPLRASGLSDCVVLLHGLARSADSMDKMEAALTESGFRVANVAYPSRDHTIEELAPLAVEDGLHLCGDGEQGGAVHFVTHSMGGILVRYYYEDRDPAGIGRVVMLAPPNQGSNAADAMRDVPGFDWINGPAGAQLGKGPGSVPLRLGKPRFEFAVIAGNRSIDPVTSAVLDNPDDGRVSVADTKLAGMADFAIVPASHAFIMKDDDAIELVRAFLEHGSFDGANVR